MLYKHVLIQPIKLGSYVNYMTLFRLGRLFSMEQNYHVIYGEMIREEISQGRNTVYTWRKVGKLEQQVCRPTLEPATG
jgi:hypothetical protein